MLDRLCELDLYPVLENILAYLNKKDKLHFTLVFGPILDDRLFSKLVNRLKNKVPIRALYRLRRSRMLERPPTDGCDDATARGERSLVLRVLNDYHSLVTNWTEGKCREENFAVQLPCFADVTHISPERTGSSDLRSLPSMLLCNDWVAMAASANSATTIFLYGARHFDLIGGISVPDRSHHLLDMPRLHWIATENALAYCINERLLLWEVDTFRSFGAELPLKPFGFESQVFFCDRNLLVVRHGRRSSSFDCLTTFRISKRHEPELLDSEQIGCGVCVDVVGGTRYNCALFTSHEPLRNAFELRSKDDFSLVTRVDLDEFYSRLRGPCRRPVLRCHTDQFVILRTAKCFVVFCLITARLVHKFTGPRGMAEDPRFTENEALDFAHCTNLKFVAGRLLAYFEKTRRLACWLAGAPLIESWRTARRPVTFSLPVAVWQGVSDLGDFRLFNIVQCDHFQVAWCRRLPQPTRLGYDRLLDTPLPITRISFLPTS